MKVEIKVPAMGESITEATVGQIIKPNGSAVAADDEILELETDKVNQVLYAPTAGVIHLDVAVDDTVTVDQVIGYVDGDAAASEAPTAAKEEEAPAAAPAAPPAPTAAPAAPAAPAATGGARQSKDAFVAGLAGGGAKAPAATPAAVAPAAPQATGERRETRTRMTKIRKVIAKRLVEAQHTTAMLTTFNEVDLTEVMGLRSRYKEQFAKDHGAKLGFMSFFVKAVVGALRAVPDINSYIDGDEVVHREYYDIGIAVGTERGLVVPVVRDCDAKGFADIELAITDYANKARTGGLSVDDLQGGGFTITNGGIYGSLLSTPILNSPQSGILGMHAIQKRPVVVDDEIVIRPMMYLALSYDHRIVDGKGAVTFLVKIKDALEDPGRLLLNV